VTAQIMARAAYASPAAPTRTPRAIEYDAFARVTHRLRSALAPGAGAFSALARALHDNRSLWTALAADVADSDNGLPKDLRAQIFYLAEFATAHSRKILAGEASADILVEINTAVMRGLRHEGDRA
jgi:flagellar biosynthesis activator protein FlaF